MGIDVNKLSAATERARKMIHSDAKKDSHIIKERMADRNNSKFFSDQPNDAFSAVGSYGVGSSKAVINEQYVDDSEDKLYLAMDNQMKQFAESRNVQQQPQVISQMPMNPNSKLPKEILESFSKNYIDQSAFDPNKSVLDTLKIAPEASNVQEGTIYQPQPQQANQGGAKVDYELIKSIVEGAVKKYVNALGKKMLNESNGNDLSMIQLGGKKLNLVTRDGNIYEANLVKKGNVKDMARRNN